MDMDELVEAHLDWCAQLHLQVKIARQDCVQVTYGRRHRLAQGQEVLDVCEEATQVVNQVFNGSISAGQLEHYVQLEENRKRLSIVLLKANTLGALLVAQDNSSLLSSEPNCVARNRFFPNLAGCVGACSPGRQWLFEAWRSPEVYPYLFHSGLDIVICFQEDQSNEACQFSEDAAGGMLGFPGLDVAFIDATDEAVMSECLVL